jgi:hypothetical protein
VRAGGRTLLSRRGEEGAAALRTETGEEAGLGVSGRQETEEGDAVLEGTGEKEAPAPKTDREGSCHSWRALPQRPCPSPTSLKGLDAVRRRWQEAAARVANRMEREVGRKTQATALAAKRTTPVDASAEEMRASPH